MVGKRKRVIEDWPEFNPGTCMDPLEELEQELMHRAKRAVAWSALGAAFLAVLVVVFA